MPITTNVVSLNSAQMMCTLYNMWTGRWFFPGTPFYFTNKAEPPRYNWNIVESGVKYHNPNSSQYSGQDKKNIAIKNVRVKPGAQEE